MTEALLARLAASTPDRPVTVGRYDVVGRLGQGGMGTVYEAIDRDRGTRVALKTLQAADAAAGVRLKREFRVVADLAHPNLVPVYELGSEDGLWFFTMELVEGVAFTKWACGPAVERETVSLPMTQAITEDMPTARAAYFGGVGPAPGPPRVTMDALREALAQLASGLSALHDAGLWHGDVKPDNVLIRADGHVVVVDFGLVDAVGVGGRGERRGSTIGTPAYMASEQLAGAHAGAPADWYGVGTMLYEVLTRRLPFDADSMLDLYFQKTHHTPPTPRDLVPEVPDDLSDVCMSLLQPEPDRRPSGTQLVRLFAGQVRARERLAEQPVRSIFVGRKRELRLIEQAYGIARGGTPMIVHARGGSGIGKSAMLRSFARGVEDIDRALVLRGRCYERENIPYKAFDGIVDGIAVHYANTRITHEYAGELARVFPALLAVQGIATRALETAANVAGLEANLLRTRAWIALREIVCTIAAERAVVLAIDDLHWADTDSAQLLESIVGVVTMMTTGGPRVRLLVLAGYRPEEAAANAALASYFTLCRMLAGSVENRRVAEVALAPLPAAEAEQLARSALRGIGGAANEERLRFLAEEAAGVPFFIEELARFAAAREVGADAAISLDDAIRARVGALPTEQRALVEVVALADVPVPQSLAFAAADVPAGALAALLALRSASLLGWSGSGVDDLVSTYHDRIRQAVVDGMSAEARRGRHAALGRAVVARHAGEADGPWLYQAVRHLADGLDGGVRDVAVARLAARAGRLARQSAAFPLAFSCFERGIALLPDDAWATTYELALELHGGAAEAAYLCAEWDAMTRRCDEVIARGRTPLDRMVAWETQIDAHVGRHAYRAALDAGREALAKLGGVVLPDDVSLAALVAAVEHALAALERIGPGGLAALPDVTDPVALAAMRLQVRLAPAAYFGHQLLLPSMACNLIEASIECGLSTVTPYALVLFGLVLNTMGRYAEAHRWGSLAVELVERWPDDRKLEAATRHVAYNLVLPWITPLPALLAPLRGVWDIGRRTGDLEYASYAAHGYVHDCMYCGKPLAPLLDEALQLGAQMRALGQVNAVHVHAPFEQLLKVMCGRLETGGGSLDEAGVFSEQAELEAALREGSRSGVFVLRLAMGLARYWLGSMTEALAHFEVAHAYRDAGPSVWHQPILSQFRALAAAWIGGEHARATIDVELAALRAVAAHGPVNFAHRVAMLEGEVARLAGDAAGARAKYAEALRGAEAGGWQMDVAVVHALAGDEAAARAAYAAWGAVAISTRRPSSS